VNGTNRGQSISSNRAAAESTGRFLLLANNDIEWHPGAIDELATFLEEHPDVGAAGSLVLNPDGSLQGGAKPLPSAKTALFGRRSIITRMFPRNRFSRQQLLDWRATAGEPFPVGFVHGASLMFRREVFFAAGGFSSQLFNFGDADLCSRVSKLGKAIYCVPASRVTHYEHHGGSGYRVRQRFWRVWRFHLDVWRYYRMHYSRGAWDPTNVPVALFLAARCAASFTLQLIREARMPTAQTAQPTWRAD
jgi:GT2 family glycosyltransferase